MVKKEGKEDRYMYLHLIWGGTGRHVPALPLWGKTSHSDILSQIRYLNQAGFLELPLLPYTVNLQIR